MWANLALLLVAAVWGSSFVAQRTGMEQVGPFTFNAARFALGGLVSLLIYVVESRFLPKNPASRPGNLRDGLLLGLLLFGGASAQQIGLVSTGVGQAGFITGLYVVLVPLLLALVWRERVRWPAWVGGALVVIGLLLLSVQAGFRLSPGAGWVLFSAFLWAFHVIAVGRVATGRDPFLLAMVQCFVCALLSLPAALALERWEWSGMLLAGPAIFYAGAISTGLGYTTQIVAQPRTTPAHAVIILSGEAVFAAFFGWLLLGEELTVHQLCGCGLMLAGILLAQTSSFERVG